MRRVKILGPVWYALWKILLCFSAVMPAAQRDRKRFAQLQHERSPNLRDRRVKIPRHLILRRRKLESQQLTV